jgi:hypothetical protein
VVNEIIDFDFINANSEDIDDREERLLEAGSKLTRRMYHDLDDLISFADYVLDELIKVMEKGQSRVQVERLVSFFHFEFQNRMQ